uniref:Protein kinase domain-containing protein n=1 Tax=Heterorhabditis bacteriophora TaxID=37862 RepID=A0A1I7WT91_HETBA
MGGVCGNGRFSTVFFVESIKTGKILVAKIFSEERSTDDIEREVTILSEMNHSNLPRYKGTFISEKGLIVVMKQACGLPVIDFINRLSKSPDTIKDKFTVPSEDLLRRLSREIIFAVEYLHAKNIMHLDIRVILKYLPFAYQFLESDPANLLVDDHLTLIDFGCAQFCNEAQSNWGDGDESYSAPERSSGLSPTTKSDIW